MVRVAADPAQVQAAAAMVVVQWGLAERHHQ